MDGNSRTHRTAAENRLIDAEIVHDAEHIVAHVLLGIGLGDLGRAAIAADIDAHYLEPGGEMGGLIEPQVVIEGIGMDQDHGRAVAGDLVPNIDAVGCTLGHGVIL